MSKSKSEPAYNSSRMKDVIAIAVTFFVIGAGILAFFNTVNSWAALSFARPLMASALVAVIDVAALAAVLPLASPISRIVRLGLGR